MASEESLFAPQLHTHRSVPAMNWIAVAALLPSVFCGAYFFGMNALIIYAATLAGAYLAEAGCSLLAGKPFAMLDGSAVITALILAMLLPAFCPWYIAALGSFFAVAAAKWAFGGNGYSIINPAAAGFIFIVAVFPKQVLSNNWAIPLHRLTDGVSVLEAFSQTLSPDSATGATPLAVWKTLGPDGLISKGFENYYNLFIGAVPGSLGGISTPAILIGFILLLLCRIVKWEITLSCLTAFSLTIWTFGGFQNHSGLFTGDPFFHLLAGGILFLACFMAVDPVTTPMNIYGKIIFGILTGVLTAVFRIWGFQPEGAVYALAAGNLLTPLIDKVTRYRMYGLNKVWS